MSRYFLDTEFAEDGKTIKLISIALVCEDGREYYAVTNNWSPSECNSWVRENVIPLLPHPRHWRDPEQIADELQYFVPDAKRLVTAEFWAYFAAYDWIVLCQLFGAMSALPMGFPQHCCDLQQVAVERGIGDLKAYQPMVDGEHNALYDARWNRDVYARLFPDSGVVVPRSVLTVDAVLAGDGREVRR